MILTIDIGNTTTSFGVFEGKRLRSQFAIATQPFRTPDEITLQLKALAKTRQLHLTRASQVILCSVVPRMSSVLTESLRSLGDAPRLRSGRRPERSRRDAVPIRIVGQDLKVPLVNQYAYPEQVGQDRLVSAYAAWQRDKNDCIVVDFGTAITMDVVTRRGEYLGGVIAPGIDISLEALATKTALLPKVELREPPELLGRDTANSIRSGLIHGCAALCDGLIQRLKKQYAPGAHVTATGGAAEMIVKHCRHIDNVNMHLILEGLCLLQGGGSRNDSSRASLKIHRKRKIN